MRKEKTKKKITGLDDERGIQHSLKRSSTSRNMKPLEVWTYQRAENLKKKSSKIPKNNYSATMASAARRQIIGGGGGAARPAHGSTLTSAHSTLLHCSRPILTVLVLVADKSLHVKYHNYCCLNSPLLPAKRKTEQASRMYKHKLLLS